MVEELNRCQTVMRESGINPQPAFSCPVSHQCRPLANATRDQRSSKPMDVSVVHSGHRAGQKEVLEEQGPALRTDGAQAKEILGNTEGTAEAANSELVTSSQRSLSSPFPVRVWM